MKTAINVFTVRNIGKSLPEVVELIAEAEYDGVQFSGGLWESTPEEVNAALERTGLEVLPAHAGLEALESNFEGIVETYSAVGCDGIVLSGLPRDELNTKADLDEAVRRLTEIRERLNAQGLEFHYHNHTHEFTSVSGVLPFDVLFAKTDCYFELDVGWAAADGYDPNELLERLGGRCKLVHMKDVIREPWTPNEYTIPGRPVEIGTGDVDMRECVRTARRMAVEWLIYEHDMPEEPLASLKYGQKVLAQL